MFEYNSREFINEVAKMHDTKLSKYADPNVIAKYDLAQEAHDQVAEMLEINRKGKENARRKS